MFSHLHAGDRRQQMISLCISLSLHFAFLGWLLHRPAPRFIAPSSVALGADGSSITPLYLPRTTSGQAASAASGTKEAQRRKHQPSLGRLRWRKSVYEDALPLSRTEVEGGVGTSQASNQAPPAGSPFGTLFEGPASGDEIRPALPVVYPDPAVGSAELLGITEGDVIVEITIDESGNISPLPDVKNQRFICSDVGELK